MSLSEDSVRHLYCRYKEKAIRAYRKGRVNDSLRYLKATAFTGYSFYLGYKDDELERLLQSLSEHIVRKDDRLVRHNDECVFYDSFSQDNGGLVQQYLNALMSCGFRIHYIQEREVVTKESSAIGRMLREYPKADIITIPQAAKPKEAAQFVYDSIIETRAASLFIHTSPNAAVACCAFYALPETIIKYKINLTDHTFWIGTRFINYSLEFRPFGCYLSTKYRGIDSNKVFYIPFYPIMNRGFFQGFPVEIEGKVILFSGGNYYKIFNSEDTFFKLSKAILDACPNTVLLFAGFGDSRVLNEKLIKYNLNGRFIPIGERSDITEVFEHCDIYLNTYPFGGGLMSQYAAQLKKPIVSYHTPSTSLVEEFVCQIKKMKVSDDSFDAVVERVKMLVGNSLYRTTYGKEIHSCVVSPNLFNKLFADCIRHETNPLPYSFDASFVKRQINLQDKLAFENANKGFQRSFTKIIGLASLWQCPRLLIDALSSIIKCNRLLSVIKNHL